MKSKIIGIIASMLLMISVLPSTTAVHDSSNENVTQMIHNREPVDFTDDFIIEVIEQINESMYLEYLEDLVSFGTRFTGTPACHQAGDYLYNEFQSMGLEVRFHNWSYGGYEDRNVEATLPGENESSDEIYIICGHYDTVANCPGADDDASGVATVLAAAYILSQYSFNHTIRFVAFSGEEQWMLGSHEYAWEAYENEDNIIAVLNVDMIGFAITTTHGNYIKIYKNEASVWLSGFTINISLAYYDYIHLDVLSLGEAPSDQWYFWEYGYDGLFYHEYEFNYYYHTSQDTIENMNITYATKCSKLVLATLTALAQKGSAAPELEIEVKGGLGVSATIRNVGELDASNGEWSITFDGGIFLFPIGKVKNGSFDELATGEELQINVISIGFGGFLKPLEIIVSADAINTDKVEETMPAKIFLFFVVT